MSSCPSALKARNHTEDNTMINGKFSWEDDGTKPRRNGWQEIKKAEPITSHSLSISSNFEANCLLVFIPIPGSQEPKKLTKKANLGDSFT